MQKNCYLHYSCKGKLEEAHQKQYYCFSCNKEQCFICKKKHTGRTDRLVCSNCKKWCKVTRNELNDVVEVDKFICPECEAPEHQEEHHNQDVLTAEEHDLDGEVVKANDGRDRFHCADFILKKTRNPSTLSFVYSLSDDHQGSFKKVIYEYLKKVIDGYPALNSTGLYNLNQNTQFVNSLNGEDNIYQGHQTTFPISHESLELLNNDNEWLNCELINNVFQLLNFYTTYDPDCNEALESAPHILFGTTHEYQHIQPSSCSQQYKVLTMKMSKLRKTNFSDFNKELKHWYTQSKKHKLSSILDYYEDQEGAGIHQYFSPINCDNAHWFAVHSIMSDVDYEQKVGVAKSKDHLWGQCLAHLDARMWYSKFFGIYCQQLKYFRNKYLVTQDNDNDNDTEDAEEDPIRDNWFECTDLIYQRKKLEAEEYTHYNLSSPVFKNIEADQVCLTSVDASKKGEQKDGHNCGLWLFVNGFAIITRKNTIEHDQQYFHHLRQCLLHLFKIIHHGLFPNFSYGSNVEEHSQATNSDTKPPAKKKPKTSHDTDENQEKNELRKQKMHERRNHPQTDLVKLRSVTSVNRYNQFLFGPFTKRNVETYL